MGQLVIAVTGVSAPISFDYTASHGFVPGVIEIECSPQASIPGPIVTVYISDGLNFVRLTDCLVDYLNIGITPNGHVQRLQIFDRRWRWHKKGELSGTYNVRQPDNSVLPFTNRSPQQMAVMAFQALYESNFTVSMLPNEANDRPFVAWECESPQDVLEWLCERGGCDLAPNWHTNDMVLWPLGQGSALPSGYEQTVAVGLNRGIQADAIKFCCNYVLHQNKFELEAVGLDTDGAYKPHADLSYASLLTGLGYDSRFDPAPDQTDPIRNLAKKAFRTFRVKSFANGTWILPATGEALSSAEDVLPFRSTLLTGTYAADGSIIEDEPILEGVFMVGLDEDPDSLTNTTSSERLEVPYRFDRRNGIFHLSQPVVKLVSSSDDAIEPAELFATLSHKVRDRAYGHAFQRYIAQQSTGLGAGTPALVVRRDDLQPAFVSRYASGGTSPTTIESNLTSINQVLTSHLNALLASFTTQASDARRYAGIIPIVLDGIVRQVRWRVVCGSRYRSGGAWTWAYANNESQPGIMKLNERRRVTYVDNSREHRTKREYSRYSRLKHRGKD